MLNQDIRRTALYIFRQTPVPATIVAAVNMCIVYLMAFVAGYILNGNYLWIMIPLAFAAVTWILLADYFALCCWLLGKCRFEYLIQPVKDSKLRKKFIPLSVINAVIYTLLAIPVIVILVIFVVGLLAAVTINEFDFGKLFAFAAVYTVVTVIVMNALRFMAFIFASGADYKPLGMLKRGFTYLAGNWIGWLWFNMTVEFVPVLIWKVLDIIFNSNPAIIILYMPVMGYLMIARAGYVYENILRKEFAQEAAYSYVADSFTNQI